MDRIIVFDTTLRDGEQSPGASMNAAEKLRLATMLDTPGGASEALPLGVAIAKAVFERNGAQLAIESHTDPATVTVRFAPGDQEEAVVASYGQAPRTDR